VHLTPTPFPFDKPAGDSATANTSLAFVAGCKPEVLVNGCVQTSRWRAPGHTLLKDKLRSRMCRIEVMRAYLALEAAIGDDKAEEETYAALKARNTAYAAAKRVIRGEPRDPVGPEWNLPHEFLATGGDAPFAGWIVGGDRYASFIAKGELRG
jgi:tRNA-specific adenosine deaminase 1